MCSQRLWLPVIALALAWLVPLAAAHAKPAARKTLVGKISGAPMGTWITVATGGVGINSSFQIDVTKAKITEKKKPVKRYQLREGMKVRVQGTVSRQAFNAETIEILERPKK
jgi:hypothetical protein